MAYKRKDHLYLKAKKEGRASRASFKIDELQDKYKLIGKGNKVVDLGCAPGGWLQSISKMVGSGGLVLGFDILPLKIAVPPQCRFFKVDVTSSQVEETIGSFFPQVDVVLSDMAPNLSGVAFADAFKSYELCLRALNVAEKFLKNGGNFAAKIFPGDEMNDFMAKMRGFFQKTHNIIPKSTRQTSSEHYIIGQGFRL